MKCSYYPPSVLGGVVVVVLVGDVEAEEGVETSPRGDVVLCVVTQVPLDMLEDVRPILLELVCVCVSRSPR